MMNNKLTKKINKNNNRKNGYVLTIFSIKDIKLLL